MTAQPVEKKAKPPHKPRIPPNIRKSINRYVTTGMSKAAAAEENGITPGHLYNYLTRPHVKQFEEEIKGEFIQSVEAMRGPYKAQALEVARQLMHDAKSETVRMRAVEFFAGEAKGNSVNVAVQVNNQPAAQGYEYAHPEQEVVTIRRATDNQSGAVSPQDTDIIEHKP